MRVTKAVYYGPALATKTGPLVKYRGRGGQYIVQRKGGKGSGKHSQAVRDNRNLFAYVSYLMHFADASQLDLAKEIAKNTFNVPRDILAKMIYGTLYEVTDGDGVTYRGERTLATDIQKLLDGITQTEGAMLVYTGGAWVAVAPGADGNMLVYDATSKTPKWKAVSFPEVEGQAMLDAIASTEGDLLQRSENGWAPLGLGNTGQYLRIDPSTNLPAWSSIVLTADETQSALNNLSTLQGALFYRGQTNWQALAPGTAGQVLEVDALSGLPIWKTISTEGLAAQAILNGISNTPGAVIARDTDAWVALNPGQDGYVLTAHGTGKLPAWAQGGGGGGASIETIPAPISNPETSSDLALWSKTFAVGDITPGASRYRLSVLAQALSYDEVFGIAIYFDGIRVSGRRDEHSGNEGFYQIDAELSFYTNELIYNAKLLWGDGSGSTPNAEWFDAGTIAAADGQEHVLTVSVRTTEYTAAGALILQQLVLEKLG